ncbi:MAG: RsmD family RNA methyltransferase [Candidatus Caenarcaniphilales bacterium]|nr:RsmD family RNA methyltransferase [Candidatus Caenarcaniphilales bacterium]
MTLRWKVPNGIRPTTKKTMQVLFNTLRSHFGSFAGRRFLDLCAGSGAIGLTSLVEGFEETVLVEKSRVNCTVIRENSSRLKLDHKAKLICTDVLKLKTVDLSLFDSIFLDPPYDQSTSSYLQMIGLSLDLLTEDGLLVIECSRRNQSFLENFVNSNLSPIKRKKIGETELVFFEIEKLN